MAVTRPMSVDSVLDDVTECSICAQAFTDPRILPCHHTFCLKCLLTCGQDREPGDTMPCPLCRNEFTIPGDGFEGIQKSFLMEKLLRGRNPSTANFPTCETHPGKEMEMYCKKCKVAVCTMCFIKSHKNHYSTDIEEVSDGLRQQASSDAHKVTEDLKKTGELLVGIEKEKNDLTSQLAKVESKINEAADKLIDTIQTDRKKLLSEVDTIRQKRFKELETMKKELEQHMEALESFKRESETLLSGTACDVVSSAKSLHDRADELTKSDVTGLVAHSASRLTVNFASTTIKNTKVQNLLGVISQDVQCTAPTVTHVIPGIDQVGGVTSLDDDVFVVRANSSHVEVYDARTFALRRHIKVPGLGQCFGLAAYDIPKHLYASDWENHSVYRVDLYDDAVKMWYVVRNPRSVTSDGNVLVASEDERRLQEFTTRGILTREIQLPPVIEMLRHAVQLSDYTILVSYSGTAQHGVCLVDSDGAVLRSYGGPPGSDLTKMNAPEGLAVDKHGNVLVADCDNNRLLVLDQSLSSAHEMSVSVDEGLEGPSSLCYDESRSRLYIGEWSGGRVIVIDNLKDFRTSSI